MERIFRRPSRASIRQFHSAPHISSLSSNGKIFEESFTDKFALSPFALFSKKSGCISNFSEISHMFTSSALLATRLYSFLIFSRSAALSTGAILAPRAVPAEPDAWLRDKFQILFRVVIHKPGRNVAVSIFLKRRKLPALTPAFRRRQLRGRLVIAHRCPHSECA